MNKTSCRAGARRALFLIGVAGLATTLPSVAFAQDEEVTPSEPAPPADEAEATNFLFLYARDGVKPQPSHEPVTISLATDRYVRRNGRWLCTYRRFEHLFESDVPVTNPNLDEDK